jgi:hypothetical protein
MEVLGKCLEMLSTLGCGGVRGRDRIAEGPMPYISTTPQTRYTTANI